MDCNLPMFRYSPCATLISRITLFLGESKSVGEGIVALRPPMTRQSRLGNWAWWRLGDRRGCCLRLQWSPLFTLLNFGTYSPNSRYRYALSLYLKGPPVAPSNIFELHVVVWYAISASTNPLISPRMGRGAVPNAVWDNALKLARDAYSEVAGRLVLSVGLVLPGNQADLHAPLP